MEVAFLVPKDYTHRFFQKSFRKTKIHNVQHLQFFCIINDYFQEIPRNMYISVMKFKQGVPYRRLIKNYEDTNPEYKKFWEEPHLHAEGYDFILDFDNKHKTLKIVKAQLLRVMDFLDDMNIMYKVVFSGNGYHLWISHSNMPKHTLDWRKENSQYVMYRMIAEYLKENYAKSIDYLRLIVVARILL